MHQPESRSYRYILMCLNTNDTLNIFIEITVFFLTRLSMQQFLY